MKRLLSLALVFLVLMTSASAARIFLIEGNGGCTGNCSAGTDGVGIRNATILSNGSLTIGLTNNTILILANITGAKGDTGPAGTSDGTGGWTNTSTATNTTLNVGILGNLTVGGYPGSNAGFLRVQRNSAEQATFNVDDGGLTISSVQDETGNTSEGYVIVQIDSGANPYFRVRNGSSTTLFEANNFGDFNISKSLNVLAGNATIGTGSTSAPFLKMTKGNNRAGGMYFMLEDGTTVRGYVYMDSNEDIQINGDEVFFTTGVSDGSTNALVIEDTGDVGINTSDPVLKFEVAGSAKINSLLIGDYGLEFNTTSSQAGLATFRSTAANSVAWDIGQSTANQFGIRTSSSSLRTVAISNSGAGGARLTINGTGSTGAALDVVGSVVANGSLTLGSPGFPYNLTMFSGNGSLWNCGPSNTGVWGCS